MMEKKLLNSPRTRNFLFSLNSGLKVNIIIIGSLIVVMLGYYYWQIRFAERTFVQHAREQIRLLAGVIRFNADRAVLSQKIVEKIIGTFLGNSARFVDYLDLVRPFTEDELTEFAMEAGLSAIRIVKEKGKFTEGPKGWFDNNNVCDAKNQSLSYIKNGRYFLSIPRAEAKGCIAVGISDAEIEKLNKEISLSRLLQFLSNLPGIRYVHLEKQNNPPGISQKIPDISIVNKDGDQIARARLNLDNGILIVEFEARHYFARINQLKTEFVVFSFIIITIGIFFSWILHRYQQAFFVQMRNFERRLAREKEDAALGRAAATIAHEIRNPLNAISMGLQRLKIEADGLHDEDKTLITTILKAVKRTDDIITELRHYSMPVMPKLEKINPDSVFRHVLALYKEPFDTASIKVKYDSFYKQDIAGDLRLIEQMAENLIKNAMEAQPEGGYIHIKLSVKKRNLIISVENGGFNLENKDAQKILEPYFTTKTRGSGLGMSVINRIVRAHGGNMEILTPKPGIIKIIIFLPVNYKSEKGLP